MKPFTKQWGLYKCVLTASTTALHEKGVLSKHVFLFFYSQYKKAFEFMQKMWKLEIIPNQI